MSLGKGMVSITYLNNGVVAKHYLTPFENYTGRNINTHWASELKALRKLKGKKHFPQLISVDQSNKIIYMSYCGKPLTKATLPKDWKKQCQRIEKTLSSCGIYPFDFVGKDANPNPPHNKNIHVKDNLIHVIDFGIWSAKPPKGMTALTKIVHLIAQT